jgi:site-specific DNA recombinase
MEDVDDGPEEIGKIGLEAGACQRLRCGEKLRREEMASFYREQVAALHLAPGDADDMGRAEAANRLRSLVSRIVLTPEHGQVAIGVNGDLAGILAIAHEKTPPASADGVSQVKLVAGIGFEPMTFRL